jgi:solute carrier family 25 (mitochondrial phosphate transporter), member 23/24/25/41
MFKGNGTNVIRIFPYSAIQFATYELSKNVIYYMFKIFNSIFKIFKSIKMRDTLCLSPIERMFSGAFAGICSVSFTYPLDMIRTRLSLPNAESVSIYNCGKNIFRTEGGVFGLYRGLSPTLVGIAPNIALNFTVYEGLKNYLERKNIYPEVHYKLICGAIAGATSQSVTYPFDVIRRRMQVNNSACSCFNYKNSFDAFYKIIKLEGFSALYKGLIPNYMKVIPAISISFVTFEFIRSQILLFK